MLLARQWYKVHDALIEECVAAGGVLHVNDVLGRIDRELLAMRWEWTLARPLPLRLVARQAGFLKRWWIQCPQCRALRDSVYWPPNGTRWSCRTCAGLIYASQRHGYRHPLRRIPTHRKRIALRREVLRQERRTARIRAKQDKEPRMSAEYVAGLERTIAEVQAFGEALKREREEAARTREAAAEEMQTRLAALVEPALERLHQLAENAPSHVRERARRRLGPLYAGSVANGTPSTSDDALGTTAAPTGLKRT